MIFLRSNIMKHIQIIILICLLLAPVLQADPLKTRDKSAEALNNLLTEYQEQGYDVTGPVQFLEKTKKQIIFFRQAPVSFRRLSIISPDGRRAFLKRYDYVYVLSKEEKVVLIYLEKKETDNV